MKKIILVFSFLLSISVYGQITKNNTITTMEELQVYKKRKLMNDSIRDYFNPNDHIDSVLIYLNNYRIKNNLNILKLDKVLCKVSDLQSKYCADNLILTHIQENEDFKSCFQRGLRFNEYVDGEIAAECTFNGLTIREETVPSSPMLGFEQSKGHSFLMSQPTYKRCGISLMQSKKNKDIYYTIIVFSNH
jgi:hypothetical protein